MMPKIAWANTADTMGHKAFEMSILLMNIYETHLYDVIGGFDDTGDVRQRVW